MIILLFLVTGQPFFIDQPTPWPLQHGQYGFLLRFGPEGSVLPYAMVGILERFQLGLSYGASNLIGSEDPEFYPRPEVQAKLVLIEQQFYIPQLTLGFDSQGFGPHQGDRYRIKSKGFYLTGGEHLGLQFGWIDISLGLNYSLETVDSKTPSLFAGLMVGIGPGFGFLLDYDLGSNDPKAEGPGYFNLGLRWLINNQVLFELSLRDLFSMHEEESFNRMVKIGYYGSF
ncbi:hypothetical protein DRP53_05785 [candidate division WOR-3 bacterium]|mgnify:CR=1 FL=1|uniref:Uncharacterized protein n=1 Tax=candidate division WOR-3 bacterium TaxID=2052148 RepID=A0A660SHT9_UNCW3|nr:MAG: hypothetical protein DRP53_05785 [candidate division WOR-3 bacterium]